MTVYEINSIMKNLYFSDRESWEQARLISYCVVQSQSTKKLSPVDILKFNWDEISEEKNIEISDEDIKRLKSKAELWQKQLQ